MLIGSCKHNNLPDIAPYSLTGRLGPATWMSARQTCEDLGRNLLTVPTQDKKDSLPTEVSETR